MSVDQPMKRAWVEHIMGLPISIHVRGDDAGSEIAEMLVSAAYTELRWWDAVFSPYRENSQLSAIRRGELEVEDAAPEMAQVLTACGMAREITGGFFDYWLPGTSGGLVLDPTGIVKGWAVAEASKHLEHLPSGDFAINAGGDIVVGSSCRSFSGYPDWVVGIEQPDAPSEVACTVKIPVQGGAVATSGTSRRGAHIWDPKRGEFVNREGSVTVTGPSLVWADVWATAIFAGPPSMSERMVDWSEAYSAIVL